MNKKLLAIAIGAVVALPGAALAAGPTVYGKVNITLDSVDTEFAADTYADAGTDQWELNSNASRLGVKGDFDLEVGGLKAIYQAEYEINVDDGGAAPFSQRNIFAGLKGGFGTLQAGKFDTPMKTSEGKVDQFNDLAGDIDSFIAGQDRANNIVQYSTPKLADAITIKVAFIPAEGTDVDNDGVADDGLADTVQASVVFEQGDLYVALAHAKDSADAQADIADTFPGSRVDMTRLVAIYKIDALEIGGLYQITEAVTSGSDAKNSSALISAAFSIDRIKLKAQYGLTKGDVSDEEVTMMGIGADYKLAKVSKAFVYMTSLERDLADDRNQVVGVGLEHSF
jgi:predicted porin